MKFCFSFMVLMLVWNSVLTIDEFRLDGNELGYYRIGPDRLMFEEAVEYCENDGGWLTFPYVKEVDEMAAKMVLDPDQDVWLSLFYKNGDVYSGDINSEDAIAVEDWNSGFESLPDSIQVGLDETLEGTAIRPLSLISVRDGSTIVVKDNLLDDTFLHMPLCEYVHMEFESDIDTSQAPVLISRLHIVTSILALSLLWIIRH